MGRASNRKKAQRQASQGPQPDAAAQQAMHRLAARFQALAEETNERQDRAAAARWNGPALASLCRSDSLSLLHRAA